jgi:hypothetical protein
MEARTLGRELRVSALGMGAMGLSFGLRPAADKQDAIAVLRAAARFSGRSIPRHRTLPFTEPAERGANTTHEAEGTRVTTRTFGPPQ